MAEYLIQSETLDDIADAINAKTGGSSAMTPAEMAAAIGSISGGSSIPTVYSKSIHYENVTVPTDYETELNVPNVTTLSRCFMGCFGHKRIAIHGAKISSMANAFYVGAPDYTLKEIDLTGVDLSTCTSYYWCFEGRNGLERILGELDFTSATNVAEIIYGCRALTTIRFKANTLSISINLAQGTYPPTLLTKESLVSVANGLKAVADKTLKLTAASQTKCNSTIGVVSQITDGEETYDFFTEDASGSVTLMDFITNTKGWTVA